MDTQVVYRLNKLNGLGSVTDKDHEIRGAKKTGTPDFSLASDNYYQLVPWEFLSNRCFIIYVMHEKNHIVLCDRQHYWRKRPRLQPNTKIVHGSWSHQSKLTRLTMVVG